MLCAQGIEEWSRGLPGLCSPVVGWSPATVDWPLRRRKLRFLARGASPRCAQSSPRAGRGWERPCWPVYGGRGIGRPQTCRARANAGSGEVERVRRGTVKVPRCFIGAGHGTGLALARRGARGGAGGRALASSERVEHVALCFCPCSSLC
jgi:hypothetical protein